MSYQPQYPQTAETLRYLATMRPDNEIRQIKDLVEQLRDIRAQECMLSLLRDTDANSLYDSTIEKINSQNNDLWRGVRAQGYEVIDELKAAIINAFGPLEERRNEMDEVNEMSKTASILTDFAPVTQVYLAYPMNVKEHQDDYSPLAPFYDELLRRIPTEVEVVLFVKSRDIAQAVQAKKLREALRCVVHNELATIWLRDAVGINLGTRLVKPVTPYSRSVGDSMKLASAFLNLDLDPINLIWEGGNLVTNGQLAFISKQLLTRNNKLSQQQIEQLISEKLSVEPVWVDLPKTDKLSHTDGYLAFIAANEVLVSTYPTEWAAKYPQDQACVDAIATQARERGLHVHRLLEAPVDTPKVTSIDSAEGVYVNLLQINNKWLLPTYGKLGEAAIIQQLERLNPNGNIIPIDCVELARFGGVLHCISFCN